MRSKTSPLGSIPTGWRLVSLKDIASKIGSGATPRGGKEVYLNERENFALIRSQNVFDRYFSSEGLAFISDEQAEQLSQAWLHFNDILLNITGDGITFSRACIVPQAILPACVNQHVSIIRLDDTVAEPGFILSYLTHPQIKNYIESFNSGGSRRAITKGHIESFKIPLPPLEEQKAIAAVLSAFDDKIELNRQMNATLEEMARALFKSWFVDFDPVRRNRAGGPAQPYDHLFPDELVVDENGREFPKGWQLSKLGQVAHINKESVNQNFNHETVEYIDISSVTEGRLDKTTRYDLNNAPSRAKRLVEHGDVIWSTVRPNRKSYLLINHPPDNLVVSTGFAVISPHQIPTSYLYLWVTTDTFVQYLVNNAIGSAYPAVSAKRFSEASIILPPQQILTQFEEFVGKLYSQIANNDREAETLSHLRDTLLPKLISGEIRVPIKE